jgi:hypothetical protein
MSKHSLGAYRIVLRMRTARTLLVEGESDKSVIQRLLLEHPIEGRAVGERPAIDTPSLLSDPRLFGLGNKAQVELIAETLPVDQDKFLVLVDREWEAFDVDALQMSEIEHEYRIPAHTKVKTFGHSIENYFFEPSMLLSLLRRQLAGQVTPGILRLIEEQFTDICSIALAYSLAAKDLQLISRLSGLLSRRYVTFHDSHFQLDAEFSRCIESRGVHPEIAKQFIHTARAIQQKIGERALPVETMKWASHGHLGNETIWACVAKMLEVFGVEAGACEQVERGMQADKLKHGADALAISQNERRPLDWLARWLLGLEGTQLAA